MATFCIWNQCFGTPGKSSQKQIDNFENNESNVVGSECDGECIWGIEENRDDSKLLTKKGLTIGSLSDLEPDEENNIVTTWNTVESNNSSFSIHQLLKDMSTLFLSIARNLINSLKRRESLEKLSSGGNNKNVFANTGLGLLLLFCFISPLSGFQCPDSVPILNRQEPSYGDWLTVICSFQLGSCDQMYWYLNNTHLSATDGYILSDVQACAASISFSMDRTHEFGELRCVIETVIGNGMRKNCSSTIHLPGIRTDQDGNPDGTATADMEEDFPTVVEKTTDGLGNVKVTVDSSLGHTKNSTEIGTEDDAVPETPIIVGIICVVGLSCYCTIQLVAMVVYHCLCYRKGKHHFDKDIPLEDEEVQGCINDENGSQPSFPIQESGDHMKKVVDIKHPASSNDKIPSQVTETGFTDYGSLVMAKRGRCPELSKHAQSRNKGGSSGEDHDNNEVALDIEDNNSLEVCGEEPADCNQESAEVSLNMEGGSCNKDYQEDFEKPQDGLLPPSLQFFT